MISAVCLEYSYNCARVGLVDVLLDVVALHCLLESLDLVAVLLAAAAGNNVYINLCVVRVLGDEGVLGSVQVSLKRVVAVDDCEVDVSERTRQLLCGDLLNVEVLRVLGDVELGRVGGRVDAVLQLDEACVLKQEQRAGLVGAVVRDGDGGAVSKLLDGCGLAGVDAISSTCSTAAVWLWSITCARSFLPSRLDSCWSQSFIAAAACFPASSSIPPSTRSAPLRMI